MRSNPLSNPEPLIRRVYAFVAYRIGDGPDAEDVTSEVFERALRYQESFDGRKGDVVAWLIGIARRQIARLGVGGHTVSDADLPDRGEDPELAERTSSRLDLAEALGLLPLRDQELVALRYGADLTARQIAGLLEMQVNAVEVALHRALERLRELLVLKEPVRESGPAPVVQAETIPVREEPHA
jgi:RNA polymerase sigma factor (sigma-70 family)